MAQISTTDKRSGDVKMKTIDAETPTKKLLSIQRVIVAVDLTKHSEATVQYAARIAQSFEASLYVAHVFSPASMYEMGAVDAYNLIDQERQDLRVRLDELTRQGHKIVPDATLYSSREKLPSKSQLWRELWTPISLLLPAIIPNFLVGCSTWIKHPKSCIRLRARSWFTTKRIPKLSSTNAPKPHWRNGKMNP
jgi:Universal stress protein family